MAKEVEVEGDLKKNKAIASIKDSVDSFLNKNSEKFGFCHVEEIYISADLRTARVYVSFIDVTNIQAKIDLLNKSRNNVFSEYKKKYSSKYFPIITFISFDDQFNI